MADMINHPPHYTSHPSGVECIQVTRHMSFNIGNAVKYLWRADLKGAAVEDLEKAIWYIRDEIARRGGARPTLPNENRSFADHMAQPEIADRHPIWWGSEATGSDAPADAIGSPPDGVSEVSTTSAAESAEGPPAARVCGGCGLANRIPGKSHVDCWQRGGWMHVGATCRDWQPRSDLTGLAARDNAIHPKEGRE